jgi:hypothetical protein
MNRPGQTAGNAAYERSAAAYQASLAEAQGDYPDRDSRWHEDVAWGRQQDRIAAAEAGITWDDWASAPEEVREEARGLAGERTPTLLGGPPGDEAGSDAARWTPAMLMDEPDGLPAAEASTRDGYELQAPGEQGDGLIATHLRGELDRFAIRAEAARQIEVRAAGRARGAGHQRDRSGLEGAREQVLAAGHTRLDATAEAYEIAALMQTDAFEALADREAG